MSYCDVDDCFKPAEREQDDGRSLCAGHRKQVQRHGRTMPIAERPETPRERLFIAALGLRDADSDDDVEYDLAERRFWAAFRAAAREHVTNDPDLLRSLLSPRGGKLPRR
jgi:hypothetical protein